MFYLKGALSKLYVQHDNTAWFTPTHAKKFIRQEEAQAEADKMNSDAHKFSERVYVVEENLIYCPHCEQYFEKEEL